MLLLKILRNRRYEPQNSMNFKKNILFSALFIYLSSCAHISQKIHSLPIRSNKSAILKTLGQPFKIQRQDGLDRWVYKFVIDGRHYTRALIIKEGMLYKKEKLKPYSLKSF